MLCWVRVCLVNFNGIFLVVVEFWSILRKMYEVGVYVVGIELGGVRIF